MKSTKYILKNICSPGRVNVFLHNKFQDVSLAELSDAQLDELYAKGCPNIQLATASETKKIEASPIKIENKNETQQSKNSKKSKK